MPNPDPHLWVVVKHRFLHPELTQPLSLLLLLPLLTHDCEVPESAQVDGKVLKAGTHFSPKNSYDSRIYSLYIF